MSVATAQGYSVGYAAGADQTVLIRWNGSFVADPIIKVGDWIADVTYERIQSTVAARFQNFGRIPTACRRRSQPDEQRRVGQPAGPALLLVPDPEDHPGPDRSNAWLPLRSMVVYVNRKLEARTLLDPTTNQPVYMNAVLVCPSVVNVIPQTFFIR